MARIDWTITGVGDPMIRPTASDAFAPMKPTASAAPSAARPTRTLLRIRGGRPSERSRRKSTTPLHWLVIDATAITGLDFPAGRALMELLQDLATAGVFWL